MIVVVIIIALALACRLHPGPKGRQMCNRQAFGKLLASFWRKVESERGPNWRLFSASVQVCPLSHSLPETVSRPVRAISFRPGGELWPVWNIFAMANWSHLGRALAIVARRQLAAISPQSPPFGLSIANARREALVSRGILFTAAAKPASRRLYLSSIWRGVRASSRRRLGSAQRASTTMDVDQNPRKTALFGAFCSGPFCASGRPRARAS